MLDPSIWQQHVVGVSWPRKVAVTERDHFRKSPIAIHRPGNFMGELAQLIDRPGRLVVEGGCPRLRIQQRWTYALGIRETPGYQAQSISSQFSDIFPSLRMKS
jgi:hypothetical protein